MLRRTILQLIFSLCAFACLFGSQNAAAQSDLLPSGTPPRDGSDGVQLQKLPEGVVLVKGAVPIASDSVTPEAGNVAGGVYRSEYFRLSYPLPAGFIKRLEGPPPSDSGSYVLAELEPSDTFKGAGKATIMVTAQDLFFSLIPAGNAMDMVKYTSESLPEYYKVERPPTEVKMAGRSFVRFDYMSPAAELHWSVLATEIRCHAVQFVLASRDVKLLEALVKDMNTMRVPGEAKDDTPVCMADYAVAQNMRRRVDPVLMSNRYNPIPVRIIIDQQGKVKHVHLISAFPEQARSITDALAQWQFKPYLQNGAPVEVETGIMFGAPPRKRAAKASMNPTTSSDQ